VFIRAWFPGTNGLRAASALAALLLTLRHGERDNYRLQCNKHRPLRLQFE
jgi:hypothetical protein